MRAVTSLVRAGRNGRGGPTTGGGMDGLEQRVADEVWKRDVEDQNIRAAHRRPLGPHIEAYRTAKRALGMRSLRSDGKPPQPPRPWAPSRANDPCPASADHPAERLRRERAPQHHQVAPIVTPRAEGA